MENTITTQTEITEDPRRSALHQWLTTLNKDVQKIKEAFKVDFTGIRTDIQEARADITDIRTEIKDIRTDIKGVRIDIANHDHRFDELAESINKIHEDLSIKKDVDRIKVILREKLHAEI